MRFAAFMYLSCSELSAEFELLPETRSDSKQVSRSNLVCEQAPKAFFSASSFAGRGYPRSAH